MTAAKHAGAQPENRIDTMCDKCKQIDKHPRHHTYDIGAPNQLIVEAKHFDCCAEDGCEVCQKVLAAHPENARHGQALIDSIHDFMAKGKGDSESYGVHVPDPAPLEEGAE